MKIDNLLTLPDGRKLAYAEFGQPDGYPVLYCHAAPLCLTNGKTPLRGLVKKTLGVSAIAVWRVS